MRRNQYNSVTGASLSIYVSLMYPKTSTYNTLLHLSTPAHHSAHHSPQHHSTERNTTHATHPPRGRGSVGVAIFPCWWSNQKKGEKKGKKEKKNLRSAKRVHTPGVRTNIMALISTNEIYILCFCSNCNCIVIELHFRSKQVMESLQMYLDLSFNTIHLKYYTLPFSLLLFLNSKHDC